MKTKSLTGSRLKTWRITRGLSLHDAERIFGVNRVTWWRAECNGPRLPLLWDMALNWYDQTRPMCPASNLTQKGNP